MKKKIVALLLLASLCITSALALTSCGKEEVVEEPVETITVEIDEDVPNILEMSKAQILALTAEEVQQSIEAYLPNYREIYLIDEDQVMTEEDWRSLARIICIQLYGSDQITTDGSAAETTGDDVDIYSAPTKSDIEPMSLSEFALFMNTYIDRQMGEDYRKTENLDYTTMDEETLQEQKDAFIGELAE